MERLGDVVKLSTIFRNASVASTTLAGEYLDISNCRSVVICTHIGTMATGNTVAFQLTQAKDRDGTDVKNVTGVTGTVTANTGVVDVSATLVGTTAGETIVVNGLTFTAHATTTTVANREFAIAGSDTTDATNLVTCLTDPVYGVPNVFVTRTTNVIVIEADDDHGNTVTAVGDTHITIATRHAEAVCELSTEFFDGDNGFKYVGVSITTNATITIHGSCARYRIRYTPQQSYAAFYANP